MLNVAEWKKERDTLPGGRGYNKWSKIPTNQETHLSRTQFWTCENNGKSIYGILELLEVWNCFRVWSAG